VLTTTKIDLTGWLEEARRKLSTAADQPSIEALVLLGSLLGKSRAWIYAHSETRLSAIELNQLSNWIDRRIAGEPLPYILGKWEFYGLEFLVSADVLIPRPETELIVDLSREWLKNHATATRVVDIGTGSGCIAVALAHWHSNASLFATDISAKALHVAQQNIRKHALQTRIHLVQADLLAPLRGPFDLILANLPYIPTSALPDLAVSAFEPILALDGGPDGLALIERLLSQAAPRLSAQGRILLEIEMDQGETAAQIAVKFFPEARILVQPDLAGLPRILMIER
jgi:release factor glutamine methyltransferase